MVVLLLEVAQHSGIKGLVTFANLAREHINGGKHFMATKKKAAKKKKKH